MHAARRRNSTMRSELDVAASDAARFQSWIRERQYPSDCAATTGFFTRQDYFYKLGLGAQMVSLKFNLLHALLHKKVYHFPTTHYVNPLRCPSRSFDCYFERPSNCTRATHAAAEEVKIHWCFDVPRRRLSKLAGLRSVHSKAWYNAQLAAFLFRPNAELRAFRGVVEPAMETWGGGGAAERAKGKLLGKGKGKGRGLSDAAAAASGTVTADGTAGFAGNGSRACVAMHVRRTDKHTEDHRTAERRFSDFAQTFKSWAYWVYGGSLPGLRVLIGSEDKQTFTALPPLLAPTASYWIPSKHFVMDMSAGKAFVDINQGNNRLGELYAEERRATKQSARRNAAAARGSSPPGLGDPWLRGWRRNATSAAAGGAVAAAAEPPRYKDEGMALILQMLLMGECASLIGSFSSNVAVIVHDLMLARRGSRGSSTHTMDVNGRVYCGCGASFCMNLERKLAASQTKSSGTTKQIIDGFRY